MCVLGQRLLKGSSVLIVGMGGLGSPAALYLAAAGVGKSCSHYIMDPNMEDLEKYFKKGTFSCTRPVTWILFAFKIVYTYLSIGLTCGLTCKTREGRGCVLVRVSDMQD